MCAFSACVDVEFRVLFRGSILKHVTQAAEAQVASLSAENTTVDDQVSFDLSLSCVHNEFLFPASVLLYVVFCRRFWHIFTPFPSLVLRHSVVL